jgi:hypothetical protein
MLQWAQRFISRDEATGHAYEKRGECYEPQSGDFLLALSLELKCDY